MPVQFIYPEFLIALSAVAVPVIIHLFNFQRFKRISFTNVRFLREIRLETQSRSRLKHLLVLLMRILAVTALVLAFAQPYLPASQKTSIKGERLISVYVDNSFSMDAIGTNGTLFDEAKARARDIAESYPAGSRFHLLTNDFEGRHQRPVSREEFLLMADELKTSPSVKKFSEIISRQKEIFKTEAPPGRVERTAYFISDFQKNCTDIDITLSDTSINYNLLSLEAQERNNIYIDSAWFETPVIQPGLAAELIVRIRNKGSIAAENIPIKLMVNGIRKALSSTTIEPSSSSDIKLSFTIIEPGWQQAEIAVTDYPVTFDDTYFFSFEVSRNIPVLAINGDTPSTYLDGIFANDSYFTFTNTPEERIDYSLFSSQRLILLNGLKSVSTGLTQELKKFLASGGSLILFPSPECDLSSWRSFMVDLRLNAFTGSDTGTFKVGKIVPGHDLFSGVFEEKKNDLKENMDLPIVRKYFLSDRNVTTNKESLLKLENGDDFLSRYRYEKGKVYVFTTPLSPASGNLGKHALFVPILYRIAMMSQRIYPMSLVIGRDHHIEYDGSPVSGDNVFHITGINGFDIIPEHKADAAATHLFLHNQIRDAGSYRVSASGKQLFDVSFNYNRSESNLACYDPEVLKEMMEKAGWKNNTITDRSDANFRKTLAGINEGTKLWKFCLLLVLLFLAAEIALLKLQK